MNIGKEEILKLIKSAVREIDPDAEVILYGSRARGDEHNESDWDVLILVNSRVDLEYEMVFRHRLYDIELETGESFSVLVHNRNEWETEHWMTPLYKNISAEGIRL